MRHEARLAVRQPDGSPLRAHLELRAQQGDVGARAQLEGPDFPDALGYLYGWLHELHGRSGAGMSGSAPLSFGTVTDWAALTGARPTGEDVRALMVLDAVMAHPDAGTQATVAASADAPRELTPTKAWPAKKPQSESANG